MTNSLKELYNKFSYPASGNNHDNFFRLGVYPHIKNNKFKKILDLGCGTGEILTDIANLYPKSKITAIDFTKNFIIENFDKPRGIGLLVKKV